MKRHTEHLRSRLREENGQAFVEFAFVLPVLVLLVVGFAQVGVSFHNYLSITDAARVGARAAAVQRTNTPCAENGPARTAIKNAVSDAQWSVISSRITCTAGPNVGDQVKITIKYPYSIGVDGLMGIGVSGDMTANATERME
jgi:Flp pilus assembly protein TadG